MTETDDALRRAAVLEAMDAWSDTVYRLALCRMRNSADADDVFQTVFLRLLQHDEQFESSDHLKAWLLRVTVNCCNDVYRSPWKHAAPLDEDAVCNAKPDEYPDLAAAVAALPERQRVAVHLRYYEGYKAEEIARIVGENPSTVRSHLLRARRALKITLGGGNERA